MARKKDKEQDADPRQGLITVCILIVLGAGLFAGLALGVRQVWRAISLRQEFIVRPADVVITGASSKPEDWLSVDALKVDLLRTDRSGLLRGGVSIFTPDLAERVAAGYACSPWVRQVRSVSKEFPNRLHVELDVRMPFALISWHGQYFVVDRDGFLLSPKVYNLAWERLLPSLGPVVVVPAQTPRPESGRWEDVTVQEGLSMVALCREQFAKKVAVAQIEMQPEAREGARPAAMATLLLDGGPRVTWGRTPSSPPSVAEISTPQKAASLLAFTRKLGTNLPRLKSIDVRWDEQQPRYQ